MQKGISVIIPTLNEQFYIGRLLDSISKQSYKGIIEVIVVDGNSKDKTVEVARQYRKFIPNLTVISCQRGISIQRNKGAEKARFNALLFLDADVAIPPEFISELTDKTKDKSFISTTLFLLNDLDFRTFLIALVVYPISVFLCWKRKISNGFCIFTTKKNHNEINGFREDLKYAEDVDYGQRSIKNGTKFHFYFSPQHYYSVRRLKKTGRLKWVWLRLREAVIQESAEKRQNKVKYPYGIFNQDN